MTVRAIVGDQGCGTPSGDRARYHLSRAGKYAEDARDEAVAEVMRRRLQNPRDRTIFRSVSGQFGVGEQSLRLWVKANRNAVAHQAAHADGRDEALVADVASVNLMQVEIERLKRQLERLHAENDVLKKAFVVFSTKWGDDDN